MKKMMERFKNERGLTLVELLAVVVILAIIGTIAFVLIGNIVENSKKDAHIANAQQLIHSAKLFDLDGNDIDTTNGVNNSTLEEKGFLEPLINPWDVDADYTGTVYKDSDGNYTVKITGEKINCDISDPKPEEELLKQDRDKICGNED